MTSTFRVFETSTSTRIRTLECPKRYSGALQKRSGRMAGTPAWGDLGFELWFRREDTLGRLSWITKMFTGSKNLSGSRFATIGLVSERRYPGEIVVDHKSVHRIKKPVGIRTCHNRPGATYFFSDAALPERGRGDWGGQGFVRSLWVEFICLWGPGCFSFPVDVRSFPVGVFVFPCGGGGSVSMWVFCFSPVGGPISWVCVCASIQGLVGLSVRLQTRTMRNCSCWRLPMDFWRAAGLLFCFRVACPALLRRPAAPAGDAILPARTPGPCSRLLHTSQTNAT